MREDRAVPRVGGYRQALALAALLAAPALADGLSTFRAQLWEQQLLQVPDDAEAGDSLASALAAGDFDGDGQDDLAIGIPSEDLGAGEQAITAAGAVVVLYGAPAGLETAGAQFWTQDTPGIADAVDDHEFFGSALATGDFDGDGRGDLAIGVPWEDDAGHSSAGAVHVLYGTPSGLAATDSQLWRQSDPEVLGEPAAHEDFGTALVAGDFDGDGFDDLAIGTEADGEERLGGVNVLFGSGAGLTAVGDQYFLGSELGCAGEDTCNFGSALAAGDFDADGFSDLAIGAPADDFFGIEAVGSVRVLFGSDQGLTLERDLYLLGPQELGTQGRALAAGDFDGDGDDDLAIGIPGRDVAGRAGAGAVALRLGDDGQFLDGGEWSQETPGVLGGAEPEDAFGSALAAGDFDADGRADLAIGVEAEGVEEPEEGAVNVLRGASVAGLTASGDQLWYADLLPIADPSPADIGDHFGAALAVGDFDGNGHGDLAIGVPGENLDTGGSAGAAFVLHGSLFADGFESSDTSEWSSEEP
jgi:hypothetical protein